LSLAKNDLKFTKDFFEETFKKCYEITERELQKAEHKAADKFKSNINYDFEYDEKFQSSY
jgi:hypothetical protein